MLEIQALTNRVQELSESVDFWNIAMLWGLLFAALAAAWIGISTRLVVVRTAQQSTAQGLVDAAKDRQLQADLKEKDRQIAVAAKGAADANERAGKAEKDAATAQENLAGANARAAKASAKAEAFRLDIAKANGAAKQAEARAAEANLALERFKAPRSLSIVQREAIAARLRVFGTRRVDVLLFGNTPEVTGIANSIGATLILAGWTIGNSGSAMGGSASGVLIGTHLNSPPDVNDAANALISSLQAEGISALRLVPQYNDDLPAALTGTWNTASTAPIRIVVGTKP